MSTPPQPWWTNLIPIGNVILSAGISYIVAKGVATRGVKKQAFTDLLTRVDDLEEAAETLLLIDGSAPQAQSLYRAVNREDRRLGERLTEFFTEHKSKARIAGSNPVPPQVTTALRSLRDIATPDELLSSDRNAYPANHAVFQQLRAATASLRSAIRSEAQDMNADHLQA